MPLSVPERLAAHCRQNADAAAWLARLPNVIDQLRSRWELRLGPPFDSGEVSCAWVAPAERSDGTRAVLKVAWRHMESEQELDGLFFWDGDPTVRILEADPELGAMLLERCEPGTHLRALSEADQDVVIADLLRRLWRVPKAPHPFRPLSAMTAYWCEETLGQANRWPDEGLVRLGLHLLTDLHRTSKEENVLLATDLHAGNVLRAQRAPWLGIDPKPFLGDRAYDATQHLLNCMTRLRADPELTIERFAGLLGVAPERVRLWTFARLAAEPRDRWTDDAALELARKIAP